MDITELGRTLEAYGAGYLLTVSSEGTVKVVTVEVAVEGTALIVPTPGRGTHANLAGNRRATLVFPPREPRGFTLLVDGTATAAGDDVRVEPASAVLHRPAAHAEAVDAADTACGHDCHPVG